MRYQCKNCSTYVNAMNYAHHECPVCGNDEIVIINNEKEDEKTITPDDFVLLIGNAAKLLGALTEANSINIKGMVVQKECDYTYARNRYEIDINLSLK